MKKREKEYLFTSDDIGIRCPRDKKWESMEEIKFGRFCDGCQEKLFYVGGFTKGEVMALQRKYGKNICVAIGKRVESKMDSVVIGIPNLVE